MKLRFRKNSLRLRVNRHEVANLASGATLEEAIVFPGDARLVYMLERSDAKEAEASFTAGVIRILAPQHGVSEWATTDQIGMYFEVGANGSALKIAIEKDLECLDGPLDERDPDAFARSETSC